MKREPRPESIAIRWPRVTGAVTVSSGTLRLEGVIHRKHWGNRRSFFRGPFLGVSRVEGATITSGTLCWRLICIVCPVWILVVVFRRAGRWAQNQIHRGERRRAGRIQVFCICSFIEKPTAPKERYTPHGGSDKSHDSEFRKPPVLAQESIRVVTTAGRGTNRGTRPQTRLRGGVPSCVLLRPSSGKCWGEEGKTGTVAHNRSTCVCR